MGLDARCRMLDARCGRQSVSRIRHPLASMPQSAENDVNDWRRLYPFASHWADVPGGRMHYLDEGPASEADGESQPTLLFVHGNPTWSFHWRRLITELRSTHRCLAVDHIGCGLSEKPAKFFRVDEHIDNLCSLVNQLS